MKPTFKIGDRVIALTAPVSKDSQPRVKGKIYTVAAINYCFRCGDQRINVGPLNICRLQECLCGSDQPTEGLHWTNSRYFAKVDEDTLKQAVEAEEFEIAHTIQKELNS